MRHPILRLGDEGLRRPTRPVTVFDASLHALVDDMGGSISAEHGIGRLKRDELHSHKSAIEMRLMRAIKQTLDPRGILNPGRVV